jgi:hypothetical protein
MYYVHAAFEYVRQTTATKLTAPPLISEILDAINGRITPL